MFSWYRRYQTRRMMRRHAARTTPISGRRSWGWFEPIRWLVAFPVWMLRQFGMGIRNVTEYFSAGQRLTRDLWLGLPAVLALMTFTIATATGHVRQSTNAQRYWTTGLGFLQKGEPEAAKLMLQKAMAGDNINRQEVVFTLARAYEATNDADRAGALMESLATVNVAGYPPAHRFLAIRISDRVSATKVAPDLKEWFWHLSHADQGESAELQAAWGFYYLVGGDLEKAADAFRSAAEERPELWLQVAELEARMNDMDAVRRTLAIARRQLERQFLGDPENAQNRLLYATTLFYMGQLPEAERLLKEALAQEDNDQFRQLLAAVFVRMFDVESSGDGGLEAGFKYLVAALDYDPDYQPALVRLVSVARVDPERLEDSRKTMRRMIAGGNATAMAHFTLGSLEWLAGNLELAKLNMQQAITMDNKLSVIANNLAYLIAIQEDEPDLESALNLADQAVEAEPENADFRDTRGYIHAKLGNLSAAAIDYQKALEQARDPVPIQKALADLYQKMGDIETANEFRRAIDASTGESGGGT